MRCLTCIIVLSLAGVANAEPAESAPKPSSENASIRELIEQAVADKASEQQQRPALELDDPVTRAAVSPMLYDYYKGRRVYFATQQSRDRFFEAPHRYSEGVQRQWAANPPLRTQVKCPMTGEPIDRSVHTEMPTRRVYFASADASDAFGQLTLDAKQQRLANDDWFTYQTLCPKSEQDIDPMVYRDHEGVRIYFFCPLCRQAFDESPEKYLPVYRKHVAENQRRHAKLRPSQAEKQEAADTKARGDS